MKTTLIIFALGILSQSAQPKCLKTMFDVSCDTNEDCYKEQEFFLYCNKTSHSSTCAFNDEVYIGHVYENWDCPGQQFAAIPWGHPVSPHLASSGLDCMRLCLTIKTCFGISVRQRACYLKNDKCFDQNNLVRTPQAIIGVLRVVREDYHCGCHYPFERLRANGTDVKWYPPCPGANFRSSRYACCSQKGLCEEC